MNHVNLQKINWKIFFNKIDPSIRTHEWFTLFNEWIPGSPEIFVDVADYFHVVDGPKVILVGHYADYTFDDTGRRYGFLYGSKRDREGDNGKKILSTFAEFLKRTQQMANHPLFKGKIDLSTNEFLFLINDRGLVPNTPQSFESVKSLLEEALKPVLGAFSLDLVKDPKQKFQVTLKVKQPKSLDDLVKSISSF